MLYVTISQHGTQVIGILISSATSLLTNLDMTTAVYIILRNNFYNGHLVTPCRPIREQFVAESRIVNSQSQMYFLTSTNCNFDDFNLESICHQIQ